MPTVRQYRSQVETAVVPGAKARGVGSFDTGQGAVFQGVSDLTQGLGQLQQRLDTTAAEDAMVNFERDKNKLFFDPGAGYFNTQGRDAFDNAKDANKALEDLKRKYSEGLSTTEARVMFDGVAQQHITRGNADIIRHASQGARAWEVATIKAGVENTIENAALYRNDPDRLKVQNALGRQHVIDAAKLEGLDGEVLNERLQTYDSSFARTSIESSIADSAAQGRTALEKMGDMLGGPDRANIETKIKQREKVEKTAFDSQQAVLIANKLVSQYDNLTDITAEVEKIKDPDIQDKTLREARERYNLKKAGEKEREADAYETGIDFVTEGGTVQAFQAQYPEEWETMSAGQRNNLASGRHNVTDQVLLSSLLNKPPAELAKVNPADHASKLSKGDLGKLRTAVNSAKKGKTITNIQTPAAKVKSIAQEFFGASKTWKGKKGERVNEFLAAAQTRIEDVETSTGKKLSPTELDKVLAEFSHEVVIEDTFLFFDTTYSLKNVPPQELSAVNRVIDTLGENSKEDVLAVREYLIENNISVTFDNISRAYEQATQ